MFGGAFAGISVWLVQLAHTTIDDWMDKRRVYQWLLEKAVNDLMP